MTAKKQKEKKGWAKIPGMAADCGCLQDQPCDYHMALVRQATEASERNTRTIQCPHCGEVIEITDVPQSNVMVISCHMAAKHLDILIDALFGIPHKVVKRTRPGECPGIVPPMDDEKFRKFGEAFRPTEPTEFQKKWEAPPMETIYLGGRQLPQPKHRAGCTNEYCVGCKDEVVSPGQKHYSGCTDPYCGGCVE